MEPKTAAKIESKIGLILERKADIEEWIEGLSAGEFKADKRTMLATYKALQETAEAATDICAIILKEVNSRVNDDYTNIDRLEAKKAISKNSASALRELNSLRKRLVKR